MRVPRELGLLAATARFDATFCFATAWEVTLAADELGETNGDDAIPMSPRNHAQSLALPACVSAITAIDVMSIVFIRIVCGF
jgi:hypothetical protein